MRKPVSGHFRPSSHSAARPEAVALALQMRSEGYSLRAISQCLASVGYLNQHQRPFAAKSIVAMLLGPKIRTSN
jgi:hypothetical protein